MKGDFMGKNTGLEKFLNEAEVLFDGNTYKLNVEERQQIQEALKMAFWDAKERNKRKKK
ncbi:XRE family transcriptional regulator [uncultured Megamonas sp.]|uniref:XRE family transcriptional regulator n=1 Tax=uncultured Megamonas sp. TaxID=286140 RepID=UPI00266F2FFA|nr:XRE family transcriptional regulator [uncultured Megamonas sp.]